VRADWKPIVTSLGSLYAACVPAALQPGRKREMDDNSKRLGGLFWRLNNGDVSDDVIAQLKALCGALDERNYPHAAQIQVKAVRCCFSASGPWCGCCLLADCEDAL